MAGAFLLTAAAAPANGPPKPHLLIVGTPHFSNPGRDVLKTEVPDVLTPERQREIEEIVDRLSAFRPTQVAVEWDADEQARLDQRYADYRAGRYSLSANETDQIGLRLAARLNLPRVHAIDASATPPGGWSGYDYPAWAEAHGRGEEWRAWVADQQQVTDKSVRLMSCTPVSAWLRRMNMPQYRSADHRNYFYIARIGDRIGANPGAAWVGTWYTRNLRMLNNLRAVAPDGEDRVVAIVGAGHAYLLDQQARESGAFELDDTLAHLPQSPRDEWPHCP